MNGGGGSCSGASATEALQSTFAEAFGNPITVWDDADRPVAVRYGPTRFIASEHADLLVELKIVVPRTLNDEERRLYEELARVSNFRAREA